MKIEEMAAAIQNLACDIGINADEMAQELANYTNKVTESYVVTGGRGNSATISLIPPDNRFMTVSGTCYTSIEPNYYRSRRLKCVYCDCISSKESGTCEHCGAPLIEEEY